MSNDDLYAFYLNQVMSIRFGSHNDYADSYADYSDHFDYNHISGSSGPLWIQYGLEDYIHMGDAIMRTGARFQQCVLLDTYNSPDPGEDSKTIEGTLDLPDANSGFDIENGTCDGDKANFETTVKAYGMTFKFKCDVEVAGDDLTLSMTSPMARVSAKGTRV